MEKWVAVAADWEQSWQSKYKDMEHSPTGYIYNKTPIPPAQGSLQKRGRSDSQSQGIRESAVGLCLLLSSELHPLSPTGMTAYTWTEQGRHQWTCQSGEDQETWTLHKEL